MPTKPNSAGEQQDYVPAGNGDPSGEYADEAGANVHFQVFKKPADQSAVKGVIAEGKAKETPISVKTEQGKPEKPKQTIDEYIKAHPISNKNVEKYVRQSFDKGNDESKQFLLNGFANGNVSFERAKSGLSRCFIENGSKAPVLLMSTKNETGEDTGFYSEGGVFYHEGTHAIDYSYNRTGNLPASSTVVLSSNGTLEDSINAGREEAQKMRAIAKQDFYDSIANAKSQDPEYSKLDKDISAKQEELDKLNPYIPQIDEARKQFTSGKISYRELQAKNLEIREKQMKDQPFLKARGELWALQAKQQEANYRVTQQVYVEYGDVSDMFCASTGLAINRMSHDERYFDKKGYKGTEFFAEYVSARSTNPKSLARIKKYFPKQSALAEELFQRIMKGQ